MRLLNVRTLEFKEFYDDATRPKYVIASHRWGADEATYRDVKKRFIHKDSAGYKKVEAFAKYARNHVQNVDWLWIDTCCINKRNDAELSYSINSMFRWYRNAELCIAYLAGPTTTTQDFEHDEWFRRGWTLQELLAPRSLLFVTKDWQVIGTKGSLLHDLVVPGPDLSTRIAKYTGIPEPVLRDWAESVGVAVEDKLKWIEGRTTFRPEDMSYALFGILGVTLPVIYGEGEINARYRLAAEVRRRNRVQKEASDEILQQQVVNRERAEYWQRMVDWLAPPNPWTNHESARKLYERGTGYWLLDSSKYRSWKSGDSGTSRCLWLHGGAGCGKTILCSTAVQDISEYCAERPDFGHAVFYFSFSDQHKQTYESLLLSLVAQLGSREPGFAMLRKYYNSEPKRRPGREELEKILRASLAQYKKAFCHLDAIDECPETDAIRQRVLQGLDDILEQSPNLGILITSRDETDIRQWIEQSDTASISITTEVVDADIRKYINTQMTRNPKLSRLDPATKSLVEETLLQKADGMFRWVYCQVQELSKSKSTKPSAVKAALLALPKTLDETYERMLARIDAEDQADALTLLRWIAFSYEPLTLEQLAEARVIDPTDDPNSDGIVDIDNKGDYQDTLDILTGLVVAVAAYDQSDSKYSAGKSSPDRSASPSGTSFEASGSRCRGDDIVEVIYELSIGSDEGVADFSDMSVDSDSQRSQSAQLIHEHTTVRLAHFSVKEYLQSPRIRNNTARAYHLDPGREHRLLTHSCLTYLTYYSESSLKRSPLGRFRAFPLLRYASKNWWKHTQEQTSGNVAREVRFLLNSKHMDDFLGVHPVEEWTQSYFMDPWENTSDTNSALLFAIYHHLEEIVKTLIVAGVQIDATHDHAGRALHAAVDTGNEAIVQMLLDAKADVNLESPTYHPFAIQVAAVKGHEAIVRLLLEANADPNVQGGEYSTALQAAACHGHDGAVGLLLDGGADVDLLKRHGYHALYVVASKGYEATMRLLIGAGADVNYHCGSWGTAICAAAQRGNATMVKLLLDAKADVNLRGEGTGSALQEAAEKGHESIVRLLLDAGADVTLQKGCIDPPNTALESAVMEGREAIVRLLLTANPVPKASTSPDSVSGGEFEAILQRPGIDAATDANQALFIACMEGKEKLVPILLQAGANANARWRGDGRFVLSGAIFGDHDMVVQNLLNVANVEVDAQDQDRQTALHHASRVSNQQIVEMLLHAKADPMLSEKYGYTALMIAMGSGRKAIAQTMLNAVPDAPHELVLAGALICASELGEGNVVRKLLNDAWKASEATSSRQYWNVELFGPFERCLAFAYLAAARLWNTDIMQTLENAGAALNDQHQHGWIAPFLLWKQGTTWQQERKDSWETCERDIAAIVESRRTKLWDFVPENDEESTDAVQFSSCSF